MAQSNIEDLFERTVIRTRNAKKDLLIADWRVVSAVRMKLVSDAGMMAVKTKNGTSILTVVKEKGLSGCWECNEFPCGGMHDKIRIRAFAEFIKKNGENMMMDCLERNEKRGIVYHYPGQLVGDYDKCETVENVIKILEGL